MGGVLHYRDITSKNALLYVHADDDTAQNSCSTSLSIENILNLLIFELEPSKKRERMWLYIIGNPFENLSYKICTVYAF